MNEEVEGEQGIARYIQPTEEYEGVGYLHECKTEEHEETHLLRRTIFNEYYRPPPDYDSYITQSQIRPDLCAIRARIMSMLTGNDYNETNNNTNLEEEEDEWVKQAMEELEGNRSCLGCKEC